MFSLRSFWGREPAEADEAEAFVERRAEPRYAVFREAVLALEDYYRIRAVLTDVSVRGARVAFSARVDLPSRVTVIEPTLKLKCQARVVWQNEGLAGLEFVAARADLSGVA